MLSILIALVLDLIIGDPYNIFHPVKVMGRIISFEEKYIRKNIAKNNYKLAGFIIVIINLFLAIVPTYIIYNLLNTYLKFIFEIIVYYYCISAKNLGEEAIKVRDLLKVSLEDGRERLKYIVGRDTEDLNREEIIKATIETVSENTSDGVIAPLFYIFIFGPVGGLTHKFINTMDSMIGYKNEKYIDLGMAAARLDDIVNFIPARITGFIMCFSTFNPRIIIRSIKIMLRDRKNHAGPNPAYPEGAIAGILNIQLGGGHYYNGQYVYKATIGDDNRQVQIRDIDKTIKVMYITLFIFLTLLFLISIII